VALAMNAPMQVSSSNSLIRVAMTSPSSGSGKTTTGSSNFGSAMASSSLQAEALRYNSVGAAEKRSFDQLVRVAGERQRHGIVRSVPPFLVGSAPVEVLGEVLRTHTRCFRREWRLRRAQPCTGRPFLSIGRVKDC
jgi:hypothetical protein